MSAFHPSRPVAQLGSTRHGAMVIIRFEKPDDAVSIRQVVRLAFAQAAHSSGTESIIVDKLRENGALVLSLVAADGDRIEGHVAVSPVFVSDAPGRWVGLGPVSVHPLRQGHGIGSALIEEALKHARKSGASGCVVLGEPEYYHRFGFRYDPAAMYRNVPPPYFQVLSFDGSRPVGSVEYDAAFDAA